jgi:serine/threonine-protein kinase HipA
MPDREVEVYVRLGGDDVLAGRFWAHRRHNVESATFVYATGYLARKDSYPLDPALPLASGQLQTPQNQKIFGAFSDCSPDRWGRMLIRRRYGDAGEGSGDQSFGEADYLLGVRDDLRQGALRFRDPDTERFLADQEEDVPHLIDLPRLLDYAGRAERDLAGQDELDLLLKGGSSLGGARPKAHVIDRDGRLAIAKFPKAAADEWDVPGWEAVTLVLAREAGIAAAASELAVIADRSVHIVDRFDRRGNLRIGYSSAMTLLEATDGEPRSYLDLVEAIEEASGRATEDLRELWRRIAFSILVSNTDDPQHLDRWSVQRGEHRASPRRRGVLSPGRHGSGGDPCRGHGRDRSLGGSRTPSRPRPVLDQADATRLRARRVSGSHVLSPPSSSAGR